MSGFTLRGRVVAFLFVALAICICAPIPVYASSENGENGDDEGSNNGPVYLILSLATTFETEPPDCDCDECDCDGCDGGDLKNSLTASYSECGEDCDYCDCYECDCEEFTGSETVIIEIGTYIAGEEIGETRFETLSSLGDIELPDGRTFSSLNENEITILGAFDTFSPETVHLVSPDPEAVPRKVQEAFFLAAPLLDQLTVGGEEETLFPTTVEIATFIYETATTDPEDGGIGNPDYYLTDHTLENPGDLRGPALTEQAILENIFSTEATLDAPEDEFAEADGDLFPHPEDSDEPLFEFSLQIDPEDGELTIDVCLTVEIDIMPLRKKNVVWIDRYFGVMPVILFGSDEFVVDEIERGTLRLGGVRPYCKVFVKDFNCDGNKDVLAFWRVRSLVKAGALGKKTTELNLTADLTDGGCIKGTDSVKPKWRKKRKRKCW